MSTFENNIVHSYLGLLDKLSPNMKRLIIDFLTKSMDKKTAPDSPEEKSTSAFGAWVSEKSADEMIAELRNARSTDRKTESF